MTDIARLETRIGNLRELGELFSAMQAMAAAHMQEAHTALAGARTYAATIEQAIQDAAALPLSATTGKFALDFHAAEHRGALIVISGEQGFTGAYTRMLLDRARSEVKREPSQAVFVVGRRGAVLARERGLAVEGWLGMATRMEGVLTIARQLSKRVKDFAATRVVFGRHFSGCHFEIEVREVLPPPARLLTQQSDRMPPMHHLPRERLLQRLLSELLLAELMLALTEGFASENAARLQIMQSADTTISQKLDRLTQQRQAMRQELITSELLEVVAGADAVGMGTGAGDCFMQGRAQYCHQATPSSVDDGGTPD